MANPKEKAKASRQVSEFKDTYGLLNLFNQKLIFEREDFDPVKYRLDAMDDEYDEEELRDDPYDRDAVVKYIKQIRQSFGFDLDVDIPMWLTGLRYFTPLDMSPCDCDRPCDRYYVYEAAKFAVDEINADMNGKSTYELVEVVKCVMTISYYSLLYLALTTKKVGDDAVVTIQALVYDPIGGPMELHQWRFKPDAPAAEEA